MVKTSIHRLVFISTEKFDKAKHIARILVTEKLAACCSIIPEINSIFAWQSAIHERHEYIIMIKTTEEKLTDLSERVQQLHTDEVPEIISLPISEGLPSYLDWMIQVISD